MADEKPIEKSYKESAAEDSGVLAVRTMKGDIERLRQGLPLREVFVALPQQDTKGGDALRRLMDKPESHSATELPPKEAATPLPKPLSPRPAPPAQPPVIPRPSGLQSAAVRPLASGATGFAIPVMPQSPFAGQRPSAPPTASPIEVARSQARPVPPSKPQGSGVIEVEKTETDQALSLFQRIFPTRSRLGITVAVVAVVGIAGAYALFAYFGKPLPGTRYIFPSGTPSASAVASATPSQTPVASSAVTESPSTPPSPTPSSQIVARTPHLPVNRIALIDLPDNATSLDLIERLTNVAVSVQEQEPGDFTQVILRRTSSGLPLSASEFLALAGISTPAGLFAELSQDATLFFYTPREERSISRPNQGIVSHFGMLMPVKGSSLAVKDVLRQWEATLGGDLAPAAFGREWLPGSDAVFQDKTYQGVVVRYQNFPDPYMAVDYAVFEGSQPPMLLLTTSRESMFAVIGILNYRSE